MVGGNWPYFVSCCLAASTMSSIDFIGVMHYSKGSCVPQGLRPWPQALFDLNSGQFNRTAPRAKNSGSCVSPEAGALAEDPATGGVDTHQGQRPCPNGSTCLTLS